MASSEGDERIELPKLQTNTNKEFRMNRATKFIIALLNVLGVVSERARFLS